MGLEFCGKTHMARPRVLLADDHRMLREALTRLLEGECDVVGAVGDGEALLVAATQLQPDIIVLDIAMPRLNGLDAARHLRRTQPEAKLIFLTMSEDADVALEAFRIGASRYLLKNSAASELIAAIQDVFQVRSSALPTADLESAEIAVHAADLPQPRELSPRQCEVLQLLTQGHTMKEIARILKITPRTVAFHKYSMMEQLGVTSSAGLIQFALKTQRPPG